MFRAGSLSTFAAIILFAFCPTSIASALPQGQEGTQEPPSGIAQSGMANAGPQKAEFDNQHRPITAGGFVKNGPIVFQDVAKRPDSLVGTTLQERLKRDLFLKRRDRVFVCWITTMTAGLIFIL